MSRWRWAGIAFMDDEGNVVAWEIERPDGQFTMQQVIRRTGRYESHLKADLMGSIKQWNGTMPNQTTPIAQHPPLPVESGE